MKDRLVTKKCIECGNEYKGYFNSIACPDCRESRERRLRIEVYYSKRNASTKLVKCAWCEKDIEVPAIFNKGHKVCKECKKGVCEACGKEFKKQKKDTRCCSAKCAYTLRNSKELSPKKCLCCTHEFIPEKSTQIYCSDACKKKETFSIKTFCDRKLKSIDKEQGVQKIRESFGLGMLEAIEVYNQWRKEYMSSNIV